jgi:hypothetical protein
MLMLAGVGRLGFVLLLPLLLPTATAEQAGARSVGVCWKPFSRATLAGEVRNMSAQLSATELIVYCGLGALTNGSFGIVTAAHPNRWGQTDLCLPAIATARQGGIASIQVMVESRTDMPAFAAALGRGGQAFGREMFALLGSRYPGVSGVTFDFERGEDKSAPFPTPQQFATFLGGVVGASPRLSDGSARYAVDVSMDSKGCAYLSDFPPLLRVGVRRVRDMGECDDNRVTVPQSLNVSLANPPMVTASRSVSCPQRQLLAVDARGRRHQRGARRQWQRAGCARAAGRRAEPATQVPVGTHASECDPALCRSPGRRREARPRVRLPVWAAARCDGRDAAGVDAAAARLHRRWWGREPDAGCNEEGWAIRGHTGG